MTADRGIVSLEPTFFPEIKECPHLIPAPRGFIVSGRLDETGYGSGRFRLLMEEGSLLGLLDRSHLDVALLHPLSGKLATVQGVVHFKSNGRPRFIEARRISAQAKGDTIFEIMPEVEIGVGTLDAVTESERPKPVFRTLGKAMRHVDPMILWGTWPGDEPIEELLDQLD